MAQDRRRQEAAELRELMLKYKRVFASVEGKLVLLDILNKNFFMNSTENEREAGRRDAALDILKMRSTGVIQAYDEFINTEAITNDGVG